MSQISKLKSSLTHMHGKSKALFAAFFGVLSSLAFNIPQLFFLCWFTFGALFWLISNGTRRVFTTLLCFFMPFYVGVYFWFVSLYPLDFAGLSGIQSIGVIICAVVLIPLIHSFIMSLCIYVCLKLTNARGIMLCFVFPAAYILGEYLQSIGPLAFPWGRLFVTQIKVLPILQSASLFGSYFITFIIILCNCLLTYGLLCETQKRKRILCVSCAVGIFVINFAFGAIKMSISQNSNRTVTAVAMQGNMSSYEKWSGGVTDSAINIYTKLSKEAVKEVNTKDSTVILVTPETSFPFTLCRDGVYNSYPDSPNKRLQKISDDTGAFLIVGAFSNQDGKSYNSQFLYYPGGSEPYEFYQKTHRVPFGEFLPFRAVFETVLPSLTRLNLFGSELSLPENQPSPCSANDVHIGGIICFDSIFSDVSAQQVKNGADILVLSTNDSWYKTSKALDQHLAHAQMRAIENGVPIIRSANTGISANISSHGEVISSLQTQKRGSVISTLTLNNNRTLYTAIGDIILIFAVVFILAVTVIKYIPKKL